MLENEVVCADVIDKGEHRERKRNKKILSTASAEPRSPVTLFPPQKANISRICNDAAYQNAVREQKLANELSAATRERDFYMSRVDRAKAEDAKEKRRKVGHLP